MYKKFLKTSDLIFGVGLMIQTLYFSSFDEALGYGTVQKQYYCCFVTLNPASISCLPGEYSSVWQVIQDNKGRAYSTYVPPKCPKEGYIPIEKEGQ